MLASYLSLGVQGITFHAVREKSKQVHEIARHENLDDEAHQCGEQAKLDKTQQELVDQTACHAIIYLLA